MPAVICSRDRLSSAEESSQQWKEAELGNTQEEIRTQPLPWVSQPHTELLTTLPHCGKGKHENPNTGQAAQGAGRYTRSGHGISQQEMLQIGMLQIPAALGHQEWGRALQKHIPSLGSSSLEPSLAQVTEPFLCKARAALFFPNNVIIRQLHSCLSSSLSIIQNVEELGSVAAPLPRGSVGRNTLPTSLACVFGRV